MNQKTCESFLTCKEDKKLFMTKNGYQIKQCLKCRHRFTLIENTNGHTDKVYSDDYFFAGKDGYPNYLEEKEILYAHGIKYAKIIAKYCKPGRILDTGCAAGFILKGFQDSGWECHGIEPNDTMASYGRKELNLNIITGSLENFNSNQRFDLINMIQVIGHFYDVDKVMQNVTNLLKPGGLLLIESWDMKSFVAIVLGKQWHEYSPPSVVNWFSEDTLTQLMNYYGFQLVKKGYPAKKINLKHALSLMEEKLPKFIFKLKLMKWMSNSLGKRTLIYPPVDIKWYLFKK
jgi:2-polyprenyl-3-methyl-5-hydroxy-6-metoxy-1,4-benzoquinol methylase